MTPRRMLWAGLGVAAAAAAAGAAGLLSLPGTPPARHLPPLAQDEATATLEALKPPKRPRPVIAVIGANQGTEVTDYLMPYGILRRADVAEVVALATGPGPVSLFPALTVLPDATVAEFDARHPEGADYVIVPALYRDDDPAVLRWLAGQAARGAVVIGVCAGAKVVAAAGLLDGRAATTHWYYLDELRDRHPALRYVPDRRLVVDGRVATTTGISASMPMALTLVEAIAGRDKAQAVAEGLGVGAWEARHDSGAFLVTRAFALTAIGNRLAVWSHEDLALGLEPGMDEVSLALVADAWSRTWRSRVVTVAASRAPLPTRSGLAVIPDRTAAERPAAGLPAIGGRPPAGALDDALAGISRRYGRATAHFVAMQLEYPQTAETR